MQVQKVRLLVDEAGRLGCVLMGDREVKIECDLAYDDTAECRGQGQNLAL